MKKIYWGYGIIIYIILLLIRDLISKSLEQLYSMNEGMLYNGFMQHKVYLLIALSGSVFSFIVYFISLKISTYVIYKKIKFLNNRERIAAISLILLIVSLLCEYAGQDNSFGGNILQVAMFAIIIVTSIYIAWGLNKLLEYNVKYSVFKIAFIMSFLNIIIIC
ncbi:MAG: hypothetical protein ACRC41_18545, partial [Sarcina sp.]